jgi:hypothetical protein
MAARGFVAKYGETSLSGNVGHAVVTLLSRIESCITCRVLVKQHTTPRYLPESTSAALASHS